MLPAEQLLIPWSLVTIHLWQGQSWAEIFSPLLVVLAFGIAVFTRCIRTRGERPDARSILILLAGLLYTGARQ